MYITIFFFTHGIFPFEKPHVIPHYLICHSLWLWERKYQGWFSLLSVFGICHKHSGHCTGLMLLREGVFPLCDDDWHCGASIPTWVLNGYQIYLWVSSSSLLLICLPNSALFCAPECKSKMSFSHIKLIIVLILILLNTELKIWPLGWGSSLIHLF